MNLNSGWLSPHCTALIDLKLHRSARSGRINKNINRRRSSKTITYEAPKRTILSFTNNHVANSKYMLYCMMNFLFISALLPYIYIYIWQTKSNVAKLKKYIPIAINISPKLFICMANVINLC